MGVIPHGNDNQLSGTFSNEAIRVSHLDWRAAPSSLSQLHSSFAVDVFAAHVVSQFKCQLPNTTDRPSSTLSHSGSGLCGVDQITAFRTTESAQPDIPLHHPIVSSEPPKRSGRPL